MDERFSAIDNEIRNPLTLTSDDLLVVLREVGLVPARAECSVGVDSDGENSFEITWEEPEKTK